MSGRVNLLSVLLALQLVVMAVVLLGDSGLDEARDGPLLDFAKDAVDEIRVSAEDEDADAAVVITRSGDAWQLADGHPADAAKVTSLVDRLAGLRAAWPVATSAGAGERFEVTPDKHQRHLVLAAAGTPVVDLYLGTSPGYQQVHARRAGTDEIYSIELSNYQLPTAADDWLDKTLLQAQGEVTTVVRTDAWTLTRSDDGWLLDGTAANQERARQLVQRLGELRVMGSAPEAGSAPAVVLEITDAGGLYRLSVYEHARESQDGQDGQENDYRVTSDRREGTYALASYLAEQLLVEKAALLPVEAVGGEDTGLADGVDH